MNITSKSLYPSKQWRTTISSQLVPASFKEFHDRDYAPYLDYLHINLLYCGGMSVAIVSMHEDTFLYVLEYDVVYTCNLPVYMYILKRYNKLTMFV